MATLNVRGMATEDVEPDYGVIHCSAVGRAETAAAALEHATVIADGMRAAASGLPGVRSMRLSRASVHETFEWDESSHAQRGTGWQAVIGGSAEAGAAGVAEVAGELVAAGAQMSHVSWCVDDDNAAYRRVRARAVADARRAADDFAEALGGTVGDLISLADPGLLGGGTQMPTARGDMVLAMADGPSAKSAVSVDTELITVTVVVEASYSLA